MTGSGLQGCDRYSSQFENNHFTELCSGSEAGSYLRLIDFVYHSTLGLTVIKKERDTDSSAPVPPTLVMTLASNGTRFRPVTFRFRVQGLGFRVQGSGFRV